MLRPNEIQDALEVPEMLVANVDTSDALTIEEVLRRARKIHRQHGGMFGYDFEDWVQAWGGVSEKNGRIELNAGEEIAPGMIAADRREVSESCLGFSE